jgi:hypothetical protein
MKHFLGEEKNRIDLWVTLGDWMIIFKWTLKEKCLNWIKLTQQ